MAIYNVETADLSALDLKKNLFCRSSVELWSSPEKPLRWQSAVFKSKSEEVRFVFATDENSIRRTSYIIDICSLSYSARTISSIISDFVDLLRSTGSEETLAFVLNDSIFAAILGRFGWSYDRMFPVQIVWEDLNILIGRPKYNRSDDILIQESNDPLLASRLFIDCFFDQWKWYFERMGYHPGISSEDDLESLALRYVQGADVYFIARVQDKPVGLNSATLQNGCLTGELHTGVGVLPSGRGRGIGAQLVDHALKWLFDKGAVAAEIRTQEIPTARNSNIKMYMGCGGVRTACYRMYTFNLM